MKRLGKRKLRIKMQLTVTKNGLVVHRTTKQKRTAIYKVVRLFQTQNPDKWLLCVVYGKAVDVSRNITEIKNCGEYCSVEELLTTIKIFTEEKLLFETERWINGI